MKKTVILGLITAALNISAEATNISVIDFSGANFNIVTLSDGTPMATGGGLIRIGYFNTALQGPTWSTDIRSTDPAVAATAMQAFIPLGETAGAPLGTGAGTSTGPRFATRTISSVSYTGRLAGQVTLVSSTTGTANTASAAGVPAGTRISMLVYSDGNTIMLPGEQFGIFSADNWLMPADSGLNLQLNSNDVNLATEFYRGTSGSLRLSGFAVVPEASSSTLALLAGLGLIARRRR